MHIYTYTYVYIHVYIYMYIHIHIYMYICICICKHTHTHTPTSHKSMCTYIYVYQCIYVSVSLGRSDKVFFVCTKTEEYRVGNVGEARSADTKCLSPVGIGCRVLRTSCTWTVAVAVGVDATLCAWCDVSLQSSHCKFKIDQQSKALQIDLYTCILPA